LHACGLRSRNGAETMENLVELARSAAARWPNERALVFDQTGETLTFSEFDRHTDAIASALISAGVCPGDRVLVCSANTPLFPLAWFATLKAGAAIVPINVAYRIEDAHHLAALVEPKVAFCDVARLPLIEAIQRQTPALERVVSSSSPNGGGAISLRDFISGGDAAPPDVKITAETLANIQFTSGTSGMPKGCMLSHAYWLEFANAIRSSVLEMSPADGMLMAQAFSYLDPQWALVLCLLSGSRLVVLERFRPSQLWDKIVEHDVRFFYCLAAMPLMLLSCPPVEAERAHRLRVVMCSALPADRHAELEQRFNVPWLEAYGSTETGADLGVSWADHEAARGAATIGRPLRHRQADIVDPSFASLPVGAVGELVVRGPGMMQGYWRNPAATAEAFNNGWYRTGDLARRDESGLYFLVGRRKDMIRRAGENIAAAEVEGVLQQHPAVVLSACVAVPDPVRNEEIKVFVVRSADVGAEELAQFLEERLARFKVPRYWTFVERLPMTPSERVSKPHLSREIGPDVIDRQASIVAHR